jgi:hypothetical protein
VCGPAVASLPAVAVPSFAVSPTALLAGTLALAVAGGLALLYVIAGDPAPLADDVPPGEALDLEAVAAAAGAAAERIENDADATNEVYRAWGEMVGLLAVADPETTTPAEFADAAVAAGMDRDDVTLLTRLFEEVRYGGRDPDVREGRALDALRRIEAAYGSPDASGTDATDEPGAHGGAAEAGTVPEDADSSREDPGAAAGGDGPGRSDRDGDGGVP